MRQATIDLSGEQCRVTILCCIWLDERECRRDDCLYTLNRSVVVLEGQIGLKQLATRFQWVSMKGVSIHYSEDSARYAIQQELNYVKNGVFPELGVPWGKFGWYKETARWMCEQLREHGFVVTEPIGQLHVSQWGIILRTSANWKRFYLKASPCFCNEAAISNILSEVAPLQVQKPVVADIDARIFISVDHGESIDVYRLSDHDMALMFADLAEMQKATIGKVKELQKAGVPMYTTRWVAEHLDELLRCKEFLFMKEDNVTRKLQDGKEQIQQLLLELDRLKRRIADDVRPRGYFGEKCIPSTIRL